MPAKILVSACLLGRPVRYDGRAKTLAHPLLQQWQDEGRVVSICPELTAGFSVPRLPSEIAASQSGDAVLAGEGRVVHSKGNDVTALFIAGARAALDTAREHGCRFALLTDGSPSCGNKQIYDGNFSGQKHIGAGVTTALLRQHGIEVFGECDIEVLQARIAQLSAFQRLQ